VIGDYSLYAKVFEKYQSDLGQVQLCSQITNYLPIETSINEIGINPKSKSKNSKALDVSIVSDRLWMLLNQNRVVIEKNQLQMLLKNPKTKLNVISLYFWMIERFS
ncbi:MAG: hypothetical protein ACOYMA_21985, partial [Bacteroidia bacterium]